ncbi:putative quinol monooxygenase [Dyadobacter sp. CY356]|uniref:putative quinol monooxygenase n=1 Tax=Dyadobacter sp. CY356 TaxID=2906442 RepID=UPI001F29C514|nr:antibiotic biosynthesis monooxygenase [Dyadobacter sp. CY356]MCF0056059.1 antibiotic biosynthesis monooxygenase [Dyadobacter sp. CY356]
MLNKIIKSSILFALMFTLDSVKTFAQQDERKFRIAKLEVYPTDVEAYKDALAQHAKTAVKVEKGVLALQAVQDKTHPELFTVFEVYASEEAYQFHLKTPHFIKYKNGTLKMVKSLELIEVAPVALEIKEVLVR